MFGKNPIRKIDNTADGKLATQSIFYTLQGEGPHMLKPAIFIRLAGCHLACTFCDTEFEEGINNRLEPKEIMEKVWDLIAGLPFIPIFVITGGEPMRQDLTHLLYLLRNSFPTPPVIQIETAGSIWHPNILDTFFHPDGGVELVCSPKTPYLHPNVQKYCAHYKYILKSGSLAHDGLPTTGTQLGTLNRINQIARPPSGDGMARTIWVSPCDEKDALLNEANTQACVTSAMRFGYRVSLQAHKILDLE